MQISSRVHLIASGHHGCAITHRHDCNAYAVRCGARYFLIDAGVGVSPELVMNQLRQDGIRPELVEGLLLTHAHLDHAGGAAHLHHEVGMPVLASPRAASALESGDETLISLTSAKQAGIYAAEVRFLPCPVAQKLNDGASWIAGDCRIRAIATPGHSKDMLTYIVESPDGVLAFPGDTVFHGGKILMSATWDCDPVAYAQSLRILAEVAIDGLYPGHSIWSVHEGNRHLKASVAYLDQLLLPPNVL